MARTEKLTGAYQCSVDGKNYRYFGKVVTDRTTVWEARVFDGSNHDHPQDFLSKDGLLFVAKDDFGGLEVTISAEGVRPFVGEQIDQWVKSKG